MGNATTTAEELLPDDQNGHIGGRLQVRVLGRVDIDGHNVNAPLERRLLACLAIYRGQPIRTERLIDIVWDGHPPATASGTLLSKITRLRDRLPENRLLRTADGFKLRLEADEYDAARFELLVNAASTTSGPEALGHARDAVAMWHGEPFAEFAHDEFARGETARLTVLYQRVAERHAELLLELGHVSEALAAAEHLLHAIPNSERLCAIQARSLTRLARSVDALAAIAHFKERLIDGHGLSPLAELREVEGHILALTGEDSTPPSAPTRLATVSWPTAPTPPGPIIGRESAIGTVVAKLQSHRLVCLVGEAGIGKSRLAVAVVEDVQRRSDVDPPAAWLDGSAASSIDAALWTLGGNRRLTEQSLWDDTVANLIDGPSLLVIDGSHANEDVIVPLVTRLITETELVLLVTGRVPLAVPHASLYLVDALATGASTSSHASMVPPTDPPSSASTGSAQNWSTAASTATASDGASSASTALATGGATGDGLSDAARLLHSICAGHRVSVGVELLEAIAGRLDGHPLALELIGARIVDLPAEALLHSLNQPTERSALVAASGEARLRQEVLRSVSKLSDAARRTFVALSHFPGGAGFELVQAVVNPDSLNRLHTVTPLLELVDSGLLRVTATDVSDRRYRLLSPIADVGRALAADVGRALAADDGRALVADDGRALVADVGRALVADVGRALVADDGDSQVLTRRFAETMIDFAEHSISHDRAANEGTIARRLGAEIENLRAAYRWCRSNGEHAMSARLVSALLDEAVLRERAEVERWADELVTIDRCVNTEWGARVLAIAANAALVRGDFDRSAELAAQGSVALRAGALPTWVIANVRYMLGASHDLGKTGEVTASRGRHLDDMRAYSSQTGDPIGRAVASFSESFVHAAFGAHDRAIGPAITAVRLGRAGDSPTLAAMGSFTIANARAHVNPERAARQALDAARSARVANCSLVERHADRLEFDLSGSSSNEDLESRLERALAHVRVAHESGHREQTLQEIAGVVAPLVRLGRLTEAATILGGLERTLWGSLRTIIDARQHLISHLSLPTYQRLSRPSRRLTWHQLADLTAPMKR